MLKRIIEKNHYSFHQSFDNWEEAIKASAKPLLDDGTIEEAYLEDVINNVYKYGPYIVIIPEVAMPHSMLGAVGVNKTAVSFMKVEEPVIFNSKEDDIRQARLFFTLAAVDNNEHLSNMQELAVMFCKDGLIDDLLEAKTVEDVLAVAKKYDEE